MQVQQPFELNPNKRVSSTAPIYGVVCELQQVPHRRLLYKLHFYGIRGSTLKWIASWPSEHYQNGWPSLRPSSGLISCPSRIGFGPVLFLISINDLPDNIRSYGDCVLCRHINSLLDWPILQDDLNSLAQCETDWQMKFN